MTAISALLVVLFVAETIRIVTDNILFTCKAGDEFGVGVSLKLQSYFNVTEESTNGGTDLQVIAILLSCSVTCFFH